MTLHQLARATSSKCLAQEQAGQRSMETLLNCYCREVAGPDGQLSVGPLFGQSDSPAAVQLALRRTAGCALQLRLPQTGERVLSVVQSPSVTGNFRYVAPMYGKAPGKPWALLDWHALAGLLLRELSLTYARPENDELMRQIEDSVAVTSSVLEAVQPAPFSSDPLAAFIESEQSLVYGHPFHPAPKSRQGFSSDERARYSPELGARFALHYFAVRHEFLLERSVLDTPCHAIVGAFAPPDIAPIDDSVLIPTHPWQARHLLEHPDVVAAVRDGRLVDLGPRGEAFHPTSSIRTLFQSGNPYFYKCSLNVRITNCVRKNALYELEGALQVTLILRGLAQRLQRLFPRLVVMEEPAYMSVDLRTGDAVADTAIAEGFGLILRRGFDGVLEPGVTPLLAGALFGNHALGAARLRELLDNLQRNRGLPPEAAIEAWFSDYVAELMYPVLYSYFAHGVIFEPHLQNVVIGVAAGEVRQIFLRDFEGVKLVDTRYATEALSTISPRARDALAYSAEQGWKRIAYCLFVNHFCEAIHQLCADQPVLESRLWAVVRHHLQAYQCRYGDDASARRINALLNGEPLPGKGNLINRFFKRPDRASGYLPVNNPLALSGDHATWS